MLLLDEPLGALDAKVRKELREWLRRLPSEVHVTTLVAELGDRAEEAHHEVTWCARTTWSCTRATPETARAERSIG